MILSEQRGGVNKKPGLNKLIFLSPILFQYHFSSCHCLFAILVFTVESRNETTRDEGMISPLVAKLTPDLDLALGLPEEEGVEYCGEDCGGLEPCPCAAAAVRGMILRIILKNNWFKSISKISMLFATVVITSHSLNKLETILLVCLDDDQAILPRLDVVWWGEAICQHLSPADPWQGEILWPHPRHLIHQSEGRMGQSAASGRAPLAVVIPWSPIISPGLWLLIECVKTRTKRAKCDLATIKALHQSDPWN